MGHLDEAVEKATASLSQVAGGSPTLGQMWKDNMDNSENINQLLKVGEKSVLKCYATDIAKRISTAEELLTTCKNLHEAFGKTYRVPVKTVEQIAIGAASTLEGRILAGYRCGDLAKKKSYDKHLGAFTAVASKFGITEDGYDKYVHKALLSHLKAIVKGTT
jgi:hypothetical protein